MQDWMEGPSFLRTDHYPEESKAENTVGDDSEIVLMTQAADKDPLDDVIDRCGTWSDNEMPFILRKQSQTRGRFRLLAIE